MAVRGVQYTGEAARALTEAPLVSRDVPAALQAAALMHQRYADFGEELVAVLLDALQSATGVQIDASVGSWPQELSAGPLTLRCALQTPARQRRPPSARTCVCWASCWRVE